MMFAQANSEHCRHKIFNAQWTIDGEAQDMSLFAMIRNTEKLSPQGTIVAYSDNSSIMVGAEAERWFPRGAGAAGEPGERYGRHTELTHTLMKVETHNHPTAISPFPGAATGAGGEIRDEGATGRGARPKAGLTGFTVSNLDLPDARQPWENARDAAQPVGERNPNEQHGPYGRPDRIASPLQIMIDGPLGGAAFNNEFGRPNLGGYFRVYEQNVGGTVRGYHKPIMIAGGLGNIADQHTHKHDVPAGSLLIQIGGPGMRIGMGGGAASSMATGANTAELDFDSVQRGNPEIERRAQEVINGCWQLGAENPILSIHDVGAGGLSNAFPRSSTARARRALRAAQGRARGVGPVAARDLVERSAGALRAGHRAGRPAALRGDLRARALPVRRGRRRDRRAPAAAGRRRSDGRRRIPGRHADGSAARQAAAHASRRRARRDRACAGRRDGHLARAGRARRAAHPTVGSKSFLITIGDRSVGGTSCATRWSGRGRCRWPTARSPRSTTRASRARR
jgi:phosphoribosylformylglycinamidine synthase